MGRSATQAALAATVAVAWVASAHCSTRLQEAYRASFVVTYSHEVASGAAAAVRSVRS